MPGAAELILERFDQQFSWEATVGELWACRSRVEWVKDRDRDEISEVNASSRSSRTVIESGRSSWMLSEERRARTRKGGLEAEV